MTYFNNCNNLNELKNQFRKLCKELHPDKGGQQKDFVKMMVEFKTLSKTLKNKTGFEQDKNFNESKFYDLICKFDSLENIEINFIGSFIWLTDVVTGAMYQQKEIIKSIKIDGLNVARWANKKKSWYFSPLDYKLKSRSKNTLDDLKSKYKSDTFKTRTINKLGA